MGQREESIGGSVVIDGLNMFDIINMIQKKNRRYIAHALDQVEEVLDSESEEFLLVRKIILDTQNTYTRSIFVTLFGNIEGLF